jgi:hypothetical protein
VAKFLHGTKNKFKKDDYVCDSCKKAIEREYEEKLLQKAQAKEAKAKDKNAYLHTMPYDEYLRTKHWKDFSKARLKDANYQCTKCHRSDITLNVHHLTYDRRGYERVSDVVVLCEACHKEAHHIPVPKHLIYNPVSLRDRALQAIGK